MPFNQYKNFQAKNGYEKKMIENKEVMLCLLISDQWSQE